MGLPRDAWLLVVIYTDPLRVLLLMMTCKSLRDDIVHDHMLWRRLYTAWEWRMRYTGRFSQFIARGVHPPDAPRKGWQHDQGLDKASFNTAARRIIALDKVPCCGMCGQTRRRTEPVWALRMRLCQNCLRGNLISNQAITSKYGVRLVDPIVKGGASLMEICLGRVFYFLHYSTGCNRRFYTYDPKDFEAPHRNVVMFFWLPHLKKVVDLEELYKRKRDRLAAATLFLALMRRRSVLKIIHTTHVSGVQGGFVNMTSAGKAAVLINLHNKGTRIRKPDIDREQFNSEPLFGYMPPAGLWERTKAQMGMLGSPP